MTNGDQTRRGFLSGAAFTGAALASGACARIAPRLGTEPAAGAEPEVGPAEDLMREHGVLNRILLVYDDVARRIDARAPVPAAPLEAAAGIVRRFVEDYHEHLEEEFLFPRLEHVPELGDLVAVLRTQHQRGRVLTGDILGLASAPRDRRRLKRALAVFVRMYRPHEAREDTVLFPAFHRIVPPHEYAELGERFEDEEHRRFGARGFEGIVDEVGQIERELGIFDLDSFTPS